MNVEFQKTLRRLIDDRFRSQRQFCLYYNEFEPKNVTLSTTSICDLLKRGERGFTVKHIPKLCKFFNVSADYLLGIEKTDGIAKISAEDKGKAVEVEIKGDKLELVALLREIYKAIEKEGHMTKAELIMSVFTALTRGIEK